MQYSALLFGSLALIGCSLDHVVLAELDQAGAAGALAGAATSSPIAVGGSANTSVSAGTGGLMMAAIQAAGEAGQLQFASGGAVQNGEARQGRPALFPSYAVRAWGGSKGNCAAVMASHTLRSAATLARVFRRRWLVGMRALVSQLTLKAWARPRGSLRTAWPRPNAVMA